MAAVEDAVANDVVPEASIPAWKRLKNLKLYSLWIIYAALGVVALGFDFSLYPSLLAYPTFAKKFGNLDPSTGTYIVSSRIQAAWNGSSSGCQFLFGIIASPFMERFGRKVWFGVMIVFQFVSIGIVYASDSWQVLCVGRALQGCSIGGLATFSPLYIGENSIPELRGFYLISFNSFTVIGQFILSLVSYGSQNIESEWQYKTPVLCMFFFPIILLVVFPWFPESPYYILQKSGNKELAQKSLLRLYGKGNVSLVETELVRLENAMITSKALALLQQEASPLDCFRGTNIKRTAAAFLALASQQVAGVIFVVGYLTYFCVLAGIPNGFNWTMYLFTVSLVANITAYWTIERFGRRELCVYGILVMGIITLIIGGLNVSPTTGKLTATVALILVWAAIYQLTIGATGFALASEVGSLRLRGYTQSIVTATQALFGWVFSFSIPYMINPDAGNLGGKVGFIFGSFSFVVFVLGFFLFPETKGLLFTEIDMLYADKIAPRHFAREIRRRRTAQFHSKEEKYIGKTENAAHTELA